ncbi:aldo/keto reductase [Tabrizicola sp.]|uniref:aldo/keto reductase n=1 Tax=Tabrizicola sp. TaxID=2005166 RepID=UPI001A379BF0|nr:aldo/keto reductase [Tabrizicola sp.]MBL9074507.1 aldo/keto reductase [Tabrizicola sp.]
MNILFQLNHQRAFGTFPLKGDDLRAAIFAAVDVGYRAFDSAQMYGNEADTGAALAECGVPRDRLCITTKVGVENYTEARFLPSVEASLKALRVDRVDVLLLHWPTPGGEIDLSLRLLDQAHKRGLATNIGLSNHTAAMMRHARGLLDTPLVTNQVEFHPLLDQSRLLAASIETGIPLSSFCSVARGEVFKYPLFAEIGAGYGKSAAQVALRWILQKGVTINTMSTRPANIRANYEVMDFTLSAIDMARIEAMTATGYRIISRDRVPYAPDFD